MKIAELDKFLGRFSKFVSWATLFLIFVGGMVTSTGSGLAVPDWPLSYGMIFPPMVGGVFYEHGHRMAAASVGFLTLCLTIFIWRKENRRWVKFLSLTALGSVILQGILGGITVLFFLPKAVSIGHGILAQTFLVLTIILAYSLSYERREREAKNLPTNKNFLKLILFCVFLVYCQLILGALMRHTGSGLAIPDFPTMGGSFFPNFDQKMLSRINNWRFDHDLPLVTASQVLIHFIHRLWALLIVITLCFLNYKAFKGYAKNKRIMNTLVWLNILLILQVFLGALTVLSGKLPIITSVHVVTGAAVLGICVLLCLRASPLSLRETKHIFQT